MGTLGKAFGLGLLVLLGGSIVVTESHSFADSIPLPACPDTSLGEAAEDCPWAPIAKALAQSSAKGLSVADAFQELKPDLWAAVKHDSKLEGMKSIWGHSVNYDEFAKAEIVSPAILDALVERIEAPARSGIIMHAGTEHTYGYLFSVLQTSFGYKRARWVEDDIESGFGFPRGTLGPSPAEGSLFANVSAFAGEIALRDQPLALARLRRDEEAAAKVVREFDFAHLQIGRLEETVIVPSTQDSAPRTVTLRTDLIPFLHVTPGKTNSMLLVYSYVDSAEPYGKLVTAFPVAKSFADTVFDPSHLGSSKPVITRYNAYVEGLSGAKPTLLGSRRVTSPLNP